MSQLDGKRTTIDGLEYTVYPLAPRRSARLLKSLAAVVVPALGIAASLKKGAASVLDVEVDGALFSRLAAEAFSRLDDRLLDDLLAAFAEVTVIASARPDDGGKLSDIFDVHFRGRMGAMLEWLGFALKSEYADVLKKTGDGIARAGLGVSLRDPGSPSTSQRTG